MSHECPHCQSQLIWSDSFGRGNMAAQEKYRYGWCKSGDIYYCPNHEGFSDEHSAMKYVAGCQDQEDILTGKMAWEDVVCESAVHYVSGSFYTYGDGELHEGYPC